LELSAGDFHDSTAGSIVFAKSIMIQSTNPKLIHPEYHEFKKEKIYSIPW